MRGQAEMVVRVGFGQRVLVSNVSRFHVSHHAPCRRFERLVQLVRIVGQEVRSEMGRAVVGRRGAASVARIGSVPREPLAILLQVVQYVLERLHIVVHLLVRVGHRGHAALVVMVLLVLDLFEELVDNFLLGRLGHLEPVLDLLVQIVPVDAARIPEPVRSRMTIGGAHHFGLRRQSVATTVVLRQVGPREASPRAQLHRVAAVAVRTNGLDIVAARLRHGR